MADCRSAYSDKIKQLDGRMNPPMAIMGANGTAAVVVPIALAAAGVTLTVANTVSLPAVAVGAGIYFTVVAVRKAEFTHGLRILNDANKGDGFQLNKFMKKVNRKFPGADKNEVISILVKANNENVFCKENPRNGKVMPFTPLKIKKYVVSELKKNHTAVQVADDSASDDQEQDDQSNES